MNHFNETPEHISENKNQNETLESVKNDINTLNAQTQKLFEKNNDTIRGDFQNFYNNKQEQFTLAPPPLAPAPHSFAPGPIAIAREPVSDYEYLKQLHNSVQTKSDALIEGNQVQEIFGFALSPDTPSLNAKFQDAIKDISPEKLKQTNPIDIIVKLGKDLPEEEKIALAKIATTYGGDFGYDYDMIGNFKNPNISSEEYWQKLREWGVAGVCRHIHKEGARILAGLGFKTGVVTTTSGGRHALTIGKRENGKTFMIDYDDYYEWDSLKELQAKYLAKNGSLNLHDYISDENGKITGIMQTDLEKTLTNQTSFTPNGASKRTQEIARNSIKNEEWMQISSNITDKTQSGKIAYGRWNHQFLAQASRTHNVDSADLFTAWVGYRYNVENKRTDALSLNYAQANYQNGNISKNIILSAEHSRRKELVNNDTTKITASGTMSAQNMLHLKKWGISWDARWEIIWNLSADHKINNNLTFKGDIYGGGDIVPQNMGWWFIKMAPKYWAVLGAEYKKNEFLANGQIGIEKNINGTEYSGNLSTKYKEYSAAFEGSHLQSKNPFIENQTKLKGSIWYETKQYGTISGFFSQEKYGNNKSSKTGGIGWSMKF